MAPYQDSIQMNLNAISTSIAQTIEAIRLLGLDDDALAAALNRLSAAVELQVTRLLARTQDVVSLTAGAGGTTWTMTALTGYPYFRAIVVDPNGESNTLNLPALGSSDRLVVTVKCLSNSGNLTISGGAANIISLAGPGATTLVIPYSFVADGLNISTYAVTLAWNGTAWHVIDTAILTA